MLKLSENKKQY